MAIGMGGKVTARDVARAAGVSTSTVDRVLNNRGGVDKAKEAAVLAAARELGLDRALDLRAARTLRVAAFIQSPDNPFHAALKDAIDTENRGPDLFNIQIRVFHVAPRLTGEMIDKVEAISAGHDAIIICVAHDDSLVPVLSRLLQAGKPVIALATDIRCPGALYVGPDNVQSGRLAGDLTGRLLGPQGGQVLVIAGVLSMIGQSERVAGFETVLTGRYPHCTIIERAESFDLAEAAGDIAYRALQRHPSIRAIYNAAIGAGPVAGAVRALGRAGEVVVITHELTPDRRALLQEGTLDAVIDQDPVLEIRIAKSAIARHYGRSAEAPLTGPTPLRIFMRENA